MSWRARQSDTRHLGLWSVGRGEENRLLLENMSKELANISRSGSGTKVVGIDLDGRVWMALDASVVQAE